MILIEQALEIISGNQPPALTCSMKLSDAPGLILAEDIAAPEPLPRFTNSAMDGFALRWDDVKGIEDGGSVSLTVIGESRAGEPFTAEVGSNEAVRISTGAMLPAGADTVVAVEDVEEEENRIIIRSAFKKQQYVRFEGEEYRQGDTLLRQGTALTPPHVGLLVSAGVHTVEVFRPPEVAIIVTGNELVDHGDEILPWQIRDANRMMLLNAVLRSGGEVTLSDRCSDQLDDIRRAIRQSADAAGIILISGGVSVGPHDLVRQAAVEEGFEQLFWKVRQKPGKPLFFARKADTLLFGLPGNPVSTMNCYAYYIHPLMQRVQGKQFSWSKAIGRLDREIRNGGNRTLFMRVALSEEEMGLTHVLPLEKQESHMLSSLALADGFFLLEPGQELPEGEEVGVYLYPWRR